MPLSIKEVLYIDLLDTTDLMRYLRDTAAFYREIKAAQKETPIIIVVPARKCYILSDFDASLPGNSLLRLSPFFRFSHLERVMCIMRKGTWIDPCFMCIIWNEGTFVKRGICVMKKVTWIHSNLMCIIRDEGTFTKRVICIM